MESSGNTMDDKKTAKDIIINQTLSTDRLEKAVEKAVAELKWSIQEGPSTSTPKYNHVLENIVTRGFGNVQDQLGMVIFSLLVIFIGLGVILLIINCNLSSTKGYLEELANGYEQSTSAEVEASPETLDQTHQQSSSDGPQRD